MKRVVVIGGGIVGLSTAYYLLKEGCKVTVIDKSNFTTGASFVNAGYITPSHIISLASPGVVSQGLKWMFNSTSPLYIKPRFDFDFFNWMFAFKRSSTKQKVESSIPVIKDINILSRELYEDIKSSGDFDFHYEHKGLLMAYKTDKMGEKEWKVGQRAIQEGLKVENLSSSEVKKLEPNANLDIKGAVYFESDAHMTPGIFMKGMFAFLKNKGVQFLIEEEVVEFQIHKNKIDKIITQNKEFTADEYVIAAGSWSSKLAKQLGVKLLLQAGKGYRINVFGETKITIPTILCEAKCAVTPMQGFTRFAGTMEFSGINHTIRKERVEAIAQAASNYYSGLEITHQEKENAQCGLRPVTPDGLPYIGRFSKCENVIFATGHAMMGWSMGPATGKLVTEIILNKKTSMDVTAFHPERKF